MAYPYNRQSNEMQGPLSPYPENNNGMTMGMPYAHQSLMPGQSPYMNTPAPPPMPMYGPPLMPMYGVMPTIVQPRSVFLGNQPQGTQCPTCQQQVVTNLRYEAGGGTWLIALLICILGGFFGCCLIPFCVSSCQDVVHTCPACNAPIGRKNIM